MRIGKQYSDRQTRRDNGDPAEETTAIQPKQVKAGMDWTRAGCCAREERGLT